MADVSAVVSALLNAGPARVALATEQVHAPHLVDAEVASALRRLVASDVVATEHAERALGAWQRLGVARHPVAGVLGRVWALRDALTAHDALAEAPGCGLVTADARLGRAEGVHCTVTIVPR